MGYVLPIVIYVGLSLVIGFLGQNRKFGFWGFFFSSLLLTPLAGLLAYFASCEKVKVVIRDKEST